MNRTREIRNARAVMREFNSVRGAQYKGGDEADLSDLLLALMVMADQDSRYGSFNGQLQRAQANYEAET